MKIYKIANDSQTSLFDYCMMMGEKYPHSKEEWDSRAQQIINNEVTDYFFAVWLNRMSENENFGLLAKNLAQKYFKKNENI